MQSYPNGYDCLIPSRFVDSVWVVGIGADGWTGLDADRRRVIEDADVLLGGKRHLAMVPASVSADRVVWPSPLRTQLPQFLAGHHGRRVVAMASGDPFFFGIGNTLAELLGPERIHALPAVSSKTLACARMRWAAESTEVISLVGRSPSRLLRILAPDHRVLVLSEDATTPRTVAQLLTDAGYGASELTVLSDLGSPEESRLDGHAHSWHTCNLSALNVIAIRCRSDHTPAPAHSVRATGLPDDVFAHDGQLTKRDVRASALARLAPLPGQLLWDIGAGAGSVGIEWMRTDRRCRAIAVEAHPERAERASTNAVSLGAAELEVVIGRAPDVLEGLEPPDAVFVGGGSTAPGVLDACWAVLRPAGRMVVHGVTLETEKLLIDRYAAYGGELTRLSVEHAEPLGSFTAWKPARPIIQWAVVKPEQESQ